MADDYSPVPGKFKAMRWDGQNTTAFKAWVQSLTGSHTFAPGEWSEVANAGPGGETMLRVVWDNDGYSRLQAVVYEGWWLLFGPYWGSDPTAYWVPGNSPWTQMTDADFTRQWGAQS